MTDHEKIINDAAIERDGKRVIACAKAFMIAEQNGIALHEISDICNKYGIKIVSCQLGCFN
ncbi:MAG: hypothetical protein JW768_06795 [Chitinispirillaceae bacterium]|nr:hypothetical protein [Chitinispirillaceae bacterium]